MMINVHLLSLNRATAVSCQKDTKITPSRMWPVECTLSLKENAVAFDLEKLRFGYQNLFKFLLNPTQSAT